MINLPYKRALKKVSELLREAQIRGDDHLLVLFSDIHTPLLIAQAWAKEDAPTAVAIGTTYRGPAMLYFLLDIFGQWDKTTNSFDFDPDARVLYRSPAWQQQVLPYSAEIAVFPVQSSLFPYSSLSSPPDEESESGPPMNRFNNLLEAVREGLESFEEGQLSVYEHDNAGDGLVGIQVAQELGREGWAVALTVQLKHNMVPDQVGMAWVRLYVVVRDIESMNVVFRFDEKPLYRSPNWQKAAVFESATQHALPPPAPERAANAGPRRLGRSA